VIDVMDRLLGAKTISDICFTECTIDGIEPMVGRLRLAHVYPNDLHIADVRFYNPFKPVPTELEASKYGVSHEGLGMLDTTMERIEAYARKQSMDFLTLTAAMPSLVTKFGKYGFQVEDTSVGKEYRTMDKRLT
jgi:hypothetical protein